ncbi:hypothetical protein GCM10027280_62340 [Micromonospora polyrhachis]|uniref:Endonuclease/exonuclease/phosphatase family metal-dependent hydrolase n=1 Tax=Micromonospora polyrhachis TaxID=1282883 RepID=A0A7W7SU53_9ACTN|nr:hypothetical protein [Micromonospora polyrhachis]MBB4961003.1 endonuclease/exonuclease/phosphatase family metal-dependent hydrolase [Micromonospora polyrhachis]
MIEPLVIATYRLRDYQQPDRPDRRRDELMEQVILDSEADIIAVQGLPGEPALFRMARETRLHCHTHHGTPTIAAAGGAGLGILWRPDIRPVPGTWWPATDQPFRYGLTWLTLDAYGSPITIANYHAPPAGETHQTRREAGLLTTALGHHDHDVFLTGTWPTPNDREPERILHAAGFHDTATTCGGHWQPTTGHWPGDPHGDQRPDRIHHRNNPARTGRIRRHTVEDTALGWAASDHLLVAVEYQPARSA